MEILREGRQGDGMAVIRIGGTRVGAIMDGRGLRVTQTTSVEGYGLRVGSEDG